MITYHATEHDFAKWRDHAKTIGDSELNYIIQDCIKARDAMKGWNPVREGYYQDQASTYNQELNERKNSTK